MSAPFMRRFYRGECVRCGRKRDGDLWCSRCAAISRARGRNRPPRELPSDVLVRYVRALQEWGRTGSTEVAA